MKNKLQYTLLIVSALIAFGAIKLVIGLNAQDQKDLSAPLQFVHPSWKGQMKFIEDNRLESEAGDFATIISRDENTILVNWDKYGEETYQIKDDGIFYLKQD